MEQNVSNTCAFTKYIISVNFPDAGCIYGQTCYYNPFLGDVWTMAQPVAEQEHYKYINMFKEIKQAET